MRVLILGDQGAVLDRLRSRITIFWPAEIPVKIAPVFCVVADEAIEAVKEYRPDILLLSFAQKREENAGRKVAEWIDRKYRKPILVAAHSDNTEEEMRQLFEGIRCVSYCIPGDRIKSFIEDCVIKPPSDGT